MPSSRCGPAGGEHRLAVADVVAGGLPVSAAELERLEARPPLGVGQPMVGSPSSHSTSKAEDHRGVGHAPRTSWGDATCMRAGGLEAAGGRARRAPRPRRRARRARAAAASAAPSAATSGYCAGDVALRAALDADLAVLDEDERAHAVPLELEGPARRPRGSLCASVASMGASCGRGRRAYGWITTRRSSVISRTA